MYICQKVNFNLSHCNAFVSSRLHMTNMRSTFTHSKLFYLSTYIGKVLDIIKSMYKSLKVSLMHQDKISHTFLTTVGLKQSEVLSEILFSIYINNLRGRLLENSRSSDAINDIPYLIHQNK